MSERKVLNKYYPPDYDPSLIPKLKLAKDRQYVIRVMAPFHMRCKTCGNYIYKGTKFNSRKETVQDDDYLGLRIFRFYIKCTKCVAEITFKTDPENTDYVIEHGATRNFEAEKLLQKQEKEIEKQREEDEGNPMKLLEMRTRDSKREMERMENLEELRDLNQRHAKVNYEGMLQSYQETVEEKKKREAEEDEEEMKTIFGSNKIRRLNDSDDEDDKFDVKNIVKEEINAPSDLLLSSGETKITNKSTKSISSVPSNKDTIKKKAQLLGIVVKKSIEKFPKIDNSNHQSDDKSELTKTMSVIKTEKTLKDTVLAKPAGLSLLGAYGSDDSNTSSDDD
uniref:splicing factor YJU2-like n=1 Tax=Styela clava TaxID=7725 RepID=UPI00193A251B|nr:splicing factor YJU2-like [Styela clava]